MNTTEKGKVGSFHEITQPHSIQSGKCSEYRCQGKSLVPGSFRQSPQKQSTEVNEIIFEVLSLLLLLLFSHCSCPTLCDPMDYTSQASLSFAIPHSLLKLMSIESVIVSNHLILCYPLLLLPSIFHSIRVFPNESALHIRWPNYSNFSFSISPSSNYSGLISIKIDRLYLLSIQGNLMSFLQYHN